MSKSKAALHYRYFPALFTAPLNRASGKCLRKVDEAKHFLSSMRMWLCQWVCMSPRIPRNYHGRSFCQLLSSVLCSCESCRVIHGSWNPHIGRNIGCPSADVVPLPVGAIRIPAWAKLRE